MLDRGEVSPAASGFPGISHVARRHDHALTRGGEFAAASREAEYRAERLPEYLRHVRLAFLLALFANLLFYLNDWRFHGQPHFPFAIAARTVIVAASLTALGRLGKVRDFPGFQRLCAFWSALVIPAGAVLVTPHTDVALFVVFMLPVIFYLVLPMSFAGTVAAGAGCAVATMGAHIAGAPPTRTSFGLALAMLTINLVMILVVIRSNRLQRLEWAATRAERAANRELSGHRLTLQTVLRAVPTPLVVLGRDDGRLIQANDAARAYFGDAALADPRVLRRIFEEGGQAVGLKERLRTPGQVVQFETRLTLADGSFRDAMLVATTALLGGEEAVLVIVVDITSRKAMEANLERLATTDPLTGLANRGRFFSLASAEIRRRDRHGGPLAVVMLDIDYFKRINDTHGHETGDAALAAFAALCRSLVREQDTVARIGGEEFAMFLPGTDRNGALALAERLRAALEGLVVEGLPVPMTVSAGISEVLPAETAVDAALSRADQALYAAKRGGRNRTVLHACAGAPRPGTADGSPP